LPAKDRDVAMVFQNYALYSHMTVEQNLGIGLKLRHTKKAERQRRVVDTARILGLEQLLKRKPAQLSGGQRQRVAMGRAMVREPLAFLMDEPLSNLDAKLRVQMRAELAQLRDRLKTTTLYVTHDQVEAMTLGDRVAVLNNGVVQQLDRPQALYNQPANVFVAAFIGSPSMNLIEGSVVGAALEFANVRLPLPKDRDLAAYDGCTVVIGIRPNEFLDATAVRDASLPTIEVKVDVIEELGAEMNVIFTLDAPSVVTDATKAAHEEATQAEQGILAVGDPATRAVCTAQVDARSGIRPGALARLCVDVDRLHFFDRESGAAIGV
jgi:multiple sugar transport system ATP-binding protein